MDFRVVEKEASWPIGEYMPLSVSKSRRKRGEKLLDYAKKDCRAFFQIDGWYLAPGRGDSFFRPDSDGDSITTGFTEDLMGGSDVRVLIGTRDPETAVRLLEKALRSLKSDPTILERSFFRGHVDTVNPDDAPPW